MNPQPEENDNVQNSAYNPFPEPQTIPSGWDLSGLTSTSQPEIIPAEEKPAES